MGFYRVIYNKGGTGGFTELFIIKVEQVGFYRVIYNKGGTGGFYRVIYNKGGTSGVLQSFL